MTNQPIKKLKSGNIQGAIWENQKEINGSMVSFNTVTIRRSWKDKEGQWRDETLNLRKTDITKVLVVLTKIQEDLLLSEGADYHE